VDRRIADRAIVTIQVISPCGRRVFLLLNNGRLLEHLHEGNFTYRTDGIRQKTPDTAEERGIQSGTWVQRSN
jgi:predicted molibdopterin-dependent oxidoreductase YjgC